MGIITAIDLVPALHNYAFWVPFTPTVYISNFCWALTKLYYGVRRAQIRQTVLLLSGPHIADAW